MTNENSVQYTAFIYINMCAEIETNTCIRLKCSHSQAVSSIHTIAEHATTTTHMQSKKNTNVKVTVLQRILNLMYAETILESSTDI